MQYFFVLGNHQALSLAEISAIFQAKKWPFVCDFLSNEVAIITSEADEEDMSQLMFSMGGVIKLGVIKGKLDNIDAGHLVSALEQEFVGRTISGKFCYGLSYYGPGKISDKVIGMSIKKMLKDMGISARWVISKEKQLSSVVVETNHLVSKGMEIGLFRFGKDVFWGKTLAVQPFKDLSFRDYGRPARDDRSGMLPPKLAQIMLNLALAKKDSTVLDPFCGSGTVVTEAMLMGCKEIYGTDVSPKAIADTEKNVAWTRDNYVTESVVEVDVVSATELTKKIAKDSIDVIATEPYLGPQRGQVDTKKVVAELNDLYSRSLVEMSKAMRSSGRLVMIWPVFQKHIRLSPDIKGWEISPLLPRLNNIDLERQITNRNTIIYGRPEQKVWREIVLLTKKR